MIISISDLVIDINLIYEKEFKTLKNYEVDSNPSFLINSSFSEFNIELSRPFMETEFYDKFRIGNKVIQRQKNLDGKVYASASGDYCYGINKNSSEDEKIASMLYLKYLTEQSNYAYDQGGIPIVKGEKYPETLSAFEGLSMIVDAPALEGEEDFYNIVNNDSELSLDADAVHVARIIEAAETKSETFEDIMNDWNARWTAAQKRNGIEIKK